MKMVFTSIFLILIVSNFNYFRWFSAIYRLKYEP